MGTLIAIDPGKRTGWARFCRKRLRAAGCLSDKELCTAPPRPFSAEGPTVAVIELPRIYNPSPVPPNDLLDLAVLVGDLRGYYRRLGFKVELVYPRTWKGTVPKKIHNARTLAKLTAAEVELLPKRPRAKDYDHNMLDSVGLGLWWLEKEGER